MNRRESLRLLAGTAVLAASGILRTPAFAQAQPTDGPFKLPPLGYANDALEPHIDAQTMMIHHDRHHAAYVSACNNFAKQVPELGTTPIEKTLADPAYLPLQIQQAVKNNLGGHYNHTFFWDGMKPAGGCAPPAGDVSDVINSFGGWTAFREKWVTEGAGRFGSGYVWIPLVLPLVGLFYLWRTRPKRQARLAH